MIEIKALEKLYKLHIPGGYGFESYVKEAADDIQAEVDSNFAELEGFAKRVENAVNNSEDLTLFGRDYMLLPVDADGVPIRVGDLLEYQCEGMSRLHAQGVYVYKDGRKCVMNESLGIWLPEQCHHVKPRMLEDILEELVECATFPGEPLDRGDIEGFAAEIRELLGSDK